MKVYGIGPLEQWQHELRKVSRSGLVELVEHLFFTLGVTTQPADAQARIAFAKKNGRWIDGHNSHMRLMADLSGEVEKRYRKSVAAKKAARRKKRQKRNA